MRRHSRAGSKSVKERHRKAAVKSGPLHQKVRARFAPVPDRETEVAKLTRERDEALLREIANAEILRLISSSPGDLEIVFRTILEHSTRICNANFGNLFHFDGEKFYPAAQFNTPAALLEALIQRGPFKPTPGSSLDHVMRTKQVFHCADMAAERVPGLSTKLGGARSQVTVPMLKDDALIGVILIYRQEVLPFTDKQIALLQNFAAQAIIAIENTRLLNELRQSLEQQTATAEVLSVISSSPGELEPVFQSMLEKATQLCEASFGSLLLLEGDNFRRVALHNTPAKYAEFSDKNPLFHYRQSYILNRLVETKQTVHVSDMIVAEPEVPIAKFGNARTLVVVPMLKENQLVGAINIYRQEVRPFTEKQVELLQNFANQAVIAIDNARLLNELRHRTDDLSQALEQQTATSEVLGIISRSPTNAQPVFDAIVESAARLCDAVFSVIWLYDGDVLRHVASNNFTPEVINRILQTFPKRPDRSTVGGRAVLDGMLTHIPDTLTDPDYSRELALAGNWRSVLAAPMLRNGKPIGAISVGKSEPVPFSEQQIQMLSTFADQAVIAIENVRLFEEVQTRTEDLEESLQQADRDRRCT